MDEAINLDKIEKVDGDFERRYHTLSNEFKDMNIFFKLFNEEAAKKYSEVYTCLKNLNKKLPKRN